MADTGVTPSKAVKRAWIFSQDEEAWSFDAVIRETHHSELVVTDNPVETGIVISDHAYMAPLRLDIEADVGDVWLRAKNQDGNPVADVFGGESGRSVVAFTMLQNLQASAVPFSVQTGLRLYDNLVITTLDTDQDHRTGAILRFRASLRQVQFVSTSDVTVPPRKAGKTNSQASKKVTSGEKKTETVDDKAKAASVAYQWLGRLF